MADRVAVSGPIAHDSDTVKWLAWARRYADNIDSHVSTDYNFAEGVLAVNAHHRAEWYYRV
jgi:hypothetical protein